MNFFLYLKMQKSLESMTGSSRISQKATTDWIQQINYIFYSRLFSIV